MVRKIRVLHIGLSSNIGGIESVVRSWLCYKPENVEFDFVNLENSPIAYEEIFKEKKCNVISVTPRKKNPYKCKKELRKIIKDGNYDYVHHHIMSLSWLDPLIIVNKQDNIKCILHSHCAIDGNLSLKYRILHQIGKITLRNNKSLKISCGQYVGETMFCGDEFSIIENGINIEYFKFDMKHRLDIRKRLDINTKFVIGHIGRPGPQKNYPFILRTFKQICMNDNNCRLLLIGDIQEDAEVQGLIDKYHLRDKVICTGKVIDTYKYYSAMDLFFFPSLYEGLSVSLIEAQISGLQCVVSNKVANESAISELLTFISINDIEEAVKIINEKRNLTSNRTNVKYNTSYDIRKSSKKIYKYYEDNL